MLGQSWTLSPRLVDDIRNALAESHTRTLYVIVPQQSTLETERLLLTALALPGAFQLQVLSPERLCHTIFDAVGHPGADTIRIDERGRAILMRRAIQNVKSTLTWYKNALHQRGFERRALEEWTRFKQSGLTDDDLAQLIDTLPEGAVRRKLTDLSHIYSAYTLALGQRFTDGESEILEAIARLPECTFLSEASCYLFGFDHVPPRLAQLAVALAQQCHGLSVYLPLPDGPDGPSPIDANLYVPLRRSFQEFTHLAASKGVVARAIFLDRPSPARPPIAAIAQGLYSMDYRRSTARHESAAQRRSANASLPVQIACLRTMLDEAMFAAALIRSLVRTKGWRYSDIAVLTDAPAEYADALTFAFPQYEIPLFLPEHRPASQHPLCRCLLTALRIATGGRPALSGQLHDDLASLLATGYMDVTEAEGDQFQQYVMAHGIRGKKLYQPLEGEAFASLESIRERIVTPIATLATALREASTLEAQLRALVAYLDTIHAFETGHQTRERLIAMNQRQLAAEDAQVWNRLIGTFDQMYVLMGDGQPLPLRELYETLSRSLEATDIKPLPQSGDAVLVERFGRIPLHTFKAAIIMGAYDRGRSENDGLFTDAERRWFEVESARPSGTTPPVGARGHSALLGLNALDQTRQSRMYIKCALGLITDYLCVTYPSSAEDGSAVSPDPFVAAIRAMYPQIPVCGGLTRDESIERMAYSAPEAALTRIALALSETNEARERTPDRTSATGDGFASSEAATAPESGSPWPVLEQRVLQTLYSLSEYTARVQKLMTVLHCRTASESLAPSMVRRLYGALRSVSITRLEGFAACPFRHFVRYGLRPERVDPPGMTPQNEGTFYHEAVHDFLNTLANPILPVPSSDVVAQMDTIARDWIQQAGAKHFENTAISHAKARQLIRTARRAALTLWDHMQDSQFTIQALEQDFEAPLAPTPSGAAAVQLIGRIDRTDIYTDPATGDRFLRVIDYKRGGKRFSLNDAYEGLQLQLLLYLSVALNANDARPAGTFYFPIADPVVVTPSLVAEEVEDARRKRLGLMGLPTNRVPLLLAMSPRPESVLHVRLKADLSAPYASSLTASDAQFEQLIQHTIAVAGDLLRQIQAGNTAICPVHNAQMDACTYCEYRSICLRDRQLPGGDPRRVPSRTDAQIWALLSAETD